MNDFPSHAPATEELFDRLRDNARKKALSDLPGITEGTVLSDQTVDARQAEAFGIDRRRRIDSSYHGPATLGQVLRFAISRPGRPGRPLDRG